MSPFHYRPPIYQAVTVRVTLPTCVWQWGLADTGRGCPGRGVQARPPSLHRCWMDVVVEGRLHHY
ncbi:hypothetical protein Nmel_011209 [Mimus melanotis]